MLQKNRNGQKLLGPGSFPRSFEGPPGCINYFDIHARPELSRLGSAVQLSSRTMVFFFFFWSCKDFCKHNHWNPNPFHQFITLASNLLIFPMRKGPLFQCQIIVQYHPAITYATAEHQGRLFWITCKGLKLLRKAGCLELIQNLAPSVAGRRQCCIWIERKKDLYNFWKKSSNSSHCGRRYSDPPELIKIGKCSQ